MSNDWIKKKNGNQTTLYSSEGNSGIDITINKKKKSIYISGWYDSMVGIQGKELSLEELNKYFS